MVCPACRVLDPAINVCINPCVELGISSPACRRFGCPNTDTTTVETVTVGPSPIPARLLELSDNLSTSLIIAIASVIAAVGVFLVVMLVILCRRHRRRRSSAIDTGTIMQLPILFFVFVIFNFGIAI